MSDFQVVENKLQQFIKKFYINELIRGAILYLATGVFYFLLVSGVEYFFWLPPVWRAVLFWLFIAIEFSLCFVFLLRPLLKLLHLQKGLTSKEAAKIIGRHFAEIDDKLLNALELKEQSKESSELLLASIEQKSAEIKTVSFRRAINYSKNRRYIKYVGVPVLILLFISVFGDLMTFLEGYKRVSNYTQVYQPPAPYRFVIINDTLMARDTERFVLQVKTIGQSTPKKVLLTFNQQQYVMTEKKGQVFEFEFEPQFEPLRFQLKTTTVSSPTYTLGVLKTPQLTRFSMAIRFPPHTNLSPQTYANTGSARVMAGSKINWTVAAKNTKTVLFSTKNDTATFTKTQDTVFGLNYTAKSSMRYKITPNNEDVGGYEPLAYQLEVYRDESPNMDIQTKKDSLNTQVTHHRIVLSDDFGLRDLKVVCFPQNNQNQTQTVKIGLGEGLVQQLFYDFPQGLVLEEDKAYQYYFEAKDNDQPNGYKTTKSEWFGLKTTTKTEQKGEILGRQQEQISALAEALRLMREQEEQSKSIQDQQKQSNSTDWQQEKATEQLLKQEKQNAERIKKATEQIKDAIEQIKEMDPNEDPYEEALEERIKEQQEALKENQEKLKELQDLQDKINEEDFKQDLEKLAKQQKSQQKSLEQLVEQTRRYYVAKKTEQIAAALKELGEKQIEAADKKQANQEEALEAQKQLNEAFDDLKKEMDQLEQENNALKQPMELPRDPSQEQEISKEQQKATENIDQKDQEKAKPAQKKAGEKMKEMGQKMGAQMQMMQMESIEEDTEMLRQVLDNLIVFSLEQEVLMEQILGEGPNSVQFGQRINRQNTLKENFKHIDDSLFALSLRQPTMGSKINKHISDAQFYLDKALLEFADNKLSQGSASQQYVFANANALADLLDGLLTQMEQMAMSMPSPGSGEGEDGQGFQLSDVIKEQESLQQKMEQGLEEGKGAPKPGEGEGGQKGEQGQGEQQGQGKNKGDSGASPGGENSKQGLEQNYSEVLSGEIFEIFKQQQQLRQALENKLNALGLTPERKRLLENLEDIEQKILDQGYNRETLDRMRRVLHELLKIKDADLKQGQEEAREAKTSNTEYPPRNGQTIDSPKNYFEQLDILNKEALPLQPYFKKEVSRYFKKDND